MSELGHSRPGRTCSPSSDVRCAPIATEMVSPPKRRKGSIRAKTSVPGPKVAFDQFPTISAKSHRQTLRQGGLILHTLHVSNGVFGIRSENAVSLGKE